MTNNETSLRAQWPGNLSQYDLQNKALSRDAVIVYSSTLDQVIWVNVSGAKLFGGSTIGEFIAA